MRLRHMPAILVAMIVLMALLSAPLLFWLRAAGAGVFATAFFLVLWLGIPLVLPICHFIHNEKAKIILHLIAEAYFIFAIYLWISAVLGFLAYICRRSGQVNALKAGGGVLAASFLCLFAGGIINALFTRTRHVRLDLGLEKPVCIALFSDQHLGFFSTVRMVKRVTDIVNREDVDTVLIAGDFFDMDFDSLRNKEEIRSLLGGMKTKYGAFACLGNHDFYLSDPRKNAFIESAGIKILSDTTAETGGVTIFGRRDITEENRSGWESICPGKRPLIVLDHNPVEYRTYAGTADLLLCGHTHGGQTFPLDLAQKLIMPFPIYGLHEYEGLRMFVTSGAGYWGLPVRVGVCNEVVILDLY